MKKTASEFQCPDCGADLSPNAMGCHNCGARKENGQWFSNPIYDGVDLGEEDFRPHEKTGKDYFWWWVALLTLIAFVALAFQL